MFWFIFFCVLAFFIFKFFKNSARRQVRDSAKNVLEPIFNEKYAEFYYELDVPLLPNTQLTHQDACTCGRHVMIYLADNPDEAKLFLSGLQDFSGDGPPSPPDEAASYERMGEHYNNVRLPAYRGIAYIVEHYNHAFFKNVDMPRLKNLVKTAEESPGALIIRSAGIGSMSFNR